MRQNEMLLGTCCVQHNGNTLGTKYQKNPNTLLAPKRGKKMTPWVHAGSPHWLPKISIPTSIGGGGGSWTVGTLFLLRCLLYRKDLVQKLEGSTNYNFLGRQIPHQELPAAPSFTHRWQSSRFSHAFYGNHEFPAAPSFTHLSRSSDFFHAFPACRLSTLEGSFFFF
jgi:hypothetical protein